MKPGGAGAAVAAGASTVVVGVTYSADTWSPLVAGWVTVSVTVVFV